VISYISLSDDVDNPTKTWGHVHLQIVKHVNTCLSRNLNADNLVV